MRSQKPGLRLRTIRSVRSSPMWVCSPFPMKGSQDEDRDFVKGLGLLSYKPVIYVANVAEEDAAREKGFLRSEGKDYVMKDGDITNFRFNI